METHGARSTFGKIKCTLFKAVISPSETLSVVEHLDGRYGIRLSGDPTDQLLWSGDELDECIDRFMRMTQSWEARQPEWTGRDSPAPADA